MTVRMATSSRGSVSAWVASTWAAHGQAILRSYASLLFTASPVVGILLLGASCFEPAAGLAGLLAVVASSAVVRALGYRRDLADSGFFGVSALLCGLALGHGRAISWAIVVLALLLGAVATMLTAVLSELFDRLAHSPILVLPFVVTVSPLWPALNAYLGKAGEASLTHIPDLPLQLPKLVEYGLRVAGSIVFQPSTSAGLLVLLGLLVFSRLTAGFALFGMVMAGLLAVRIAPHGDPDWFVTAGYNAMLTCMALGSVFFVPSLSSLVWSVVATVVTIWLTLAIAPVAAAVGFPVLAWPFVLVTLGTLRALSLRNPKCSLQPPMLAASPERNLRLLRSLSSRFGMPGPVRVILPVRGTWTVTQGFDGEHTHQGAWQHAFDFEMTDSDGFPFRQEGRNAEDYYCFGEPVHAVMAGTVVFVYAEHEDNEPGAQNLAYPYGNVVVIQHGVGLYSVLAHLQRSSAIVQVGQFVNAGDIVARVGASGRSPRPHLHMQMQARPDIGAPTIAFDLAHYAVSRDTKAEYVPFGRPRNGDRLSGGLPFQTPELGLFAVGAEFRLADGKGGSSRIRSEISPLGERFLHDCDRDEYFYFSSLDGVATFTTLIGSVLSPLSAIGLALPRVPPFGGTVTSTETIPAEWILPSWLKLLNDLVAVVGLGAQLRGSSCVTRTDSEVTAQSQYTLRWLGRSWAWGTAAVRIVGDEIHSLRLTRGHRCILESHSAPLYPARAAEEQRRPIRFRLQPMAAVLAIPAVAVIAGLSFMLSTAPVTASALPDPLEESFRLEAAGDLPRAIQAIAKAAEQQPQQYFRVLRLAYLELKAKQYRRATEHYAAAAELAPHTVEPLLGKLEAQVADGEYVAAIDTADKIIELDSQNYAARSRRAWSLYRLERYAVAASEYTKVVELYPGDIEMRLGRAYSLSGAKHPVEAALEFREILKRVPTERRARVALGLP